MTSLGDAELERIARDITGSWGTEYLEELKDAILKALKQIRDARLVGPSDKYIQACGLKQMNLEDRGLDVYEGFWAGIRWLRSQLRLEPTETKAQIDIWAVRNKGFQLLFKEEFLARKYLMDNATTSNGLEIIKIPLICEQLPLDDVTDKPQKHYKSVQDVTARMPTEAEFLEAASYETNTADQMECWLRGARWLIEQLGIKRDE